MRSVINSRKVDLSFSENGDFIFEFGDLKDTFETDGLGFMEEIELRIKSSQNDWYFDPEYGANLDMYEGKMITPGMLESLSQSVRSALLYNDFLTSDSFDVDVGVVDTNEVAVKIFFSDNIRKNLDYKIQDFKMIFDLKNGTPKIVR